MMNEWKINIMRQSQYYTSWHLYAPKAVIIKPNYTVHGRSDHALSIVIYCNLTEWMRYWDQNAQNLDSNFFKRGLKCLGKWTRNRGQDL